MDVASGFMGSRCLFGVNIGLTADILDYHQWKYGERADAMQGVFSWFLSPVNMAMGYLLPFALRMVGFTSDWDVLYDTEILTKVFSIHTWGSVISLVLVTLPFIFYDLTKEKHDQCIKEMQERVENLKHSNESQNDIEEKQTVASEV